MLETQPSKTLRGTWDEILAHQEEIPAGSVVEMRVFEPTSENVGSENEGDYGGRSVYEVYKDLLGTVSGGPSDLAERDEEYLANSDFGMTKSLRQFDL